MKEFFRQLRRNVLRFGMRVLLRYNRLLTYLGYPRVYYAEFFTDKYLRETFFADFKYRGVVLEVGCATPMLLSMSQHFRQNGWRSIGIEPNPKFVSLHRACANEVYAYAASNYDQDDVDFVVVEDTDAYSNDGLSAHSYSALSIKDRYRDYQNQAIDAFRQILIKVKVRRLDTILAEHCPEIRQIDLLSVDVEGFELEVMRGLDLEAIPVKVIVLENLFHEAEYTEYMQSRGYSLHSKIKYNYIYVPSASG